MTKAHTIKPNNGGETPIVEEDEESSSENVRIDGEDSY